MFSAPLSTWSEELRIRLHQHDWASSVLGAPDTWPPAIRIVVRLMLDARHPMFVFWGPELGMLYNQPYVEFLQDKHPSALGRPFREVWPELWPQLAPLIERSLAGESIYIEDMPLVMFRNGCHEQTWFTFSYSPIHADDGSIVGLYGTGTDTTRRVTTERRQALQVRMADQLRGLSDPLEVMRRASRLLGEELGAGRVLFCEMAEEGSDGIFHTNYTAAPMHELLGSFQTEEFGSVIARLRAGQTSVLADIEAELGQCEPATAASFLAIDTRAELSVPVLRGGRLTSMLIVNHHQPRAWTPYEIALAEDVAERVWNAVERARAEAALREANAQLEALLGERTAERDRLWDMAQELLAVASTDGYFVSANPAITQAVGWTEEELRATPFTEFAHPEQREELLGVVAQLAAGKTITRYEIRTRHRNGSYRWLSWTVVPQGRLLYMAGRDVTEEKQGQEALHHAEEALRQAQKMEAIGQLTGGLAHDFNNMLAGVVGNLELGRFHYNAGRMEVLPRYLDGAQQAAQRAATLTHRLLAFARRQTLEPRPTDVNELVRSMADLVTHTMGPGIAVEFRLESRWRMTLCDPHQLENAILNLAINARDAMPRGGRLEIATSDVEPDRRGAVSGLMSNGYLRISVIDNGFGMDAETAARAFEPFFTTKPIGQGTGLGLSMVFGFVKQSNGQVSIASTPGEGTALHIDLERYTGETQSARVATVLPQEASPSRELTIMLVDDEASLREVLSEVLRDEGHTVFEAGDASTALAKLRHIDHVDLLVTDIGLPGGMNGRQLAEAARAGGAGTRVLLITGYAESAPPEEGLMEGVHLMIKPFALVDFRAKVREITAKL
ncbi:PAS domain-containing protein [Massilia sp. IC2-477]|uniref:PAS domain-containing protein n=1 Tax=Massilia sp. IC2-477 TaxID=2887198 RepID=UPI001D100AB9|nr:PAS domain-containing protein [Massilia sp. IC2-477]MCC2956179.1 PAS domain-containing protein [Massilia sp. IC2-477]